MHDHCAVIFVCLILFAAWYSGTLLFVKAAVEEWDTVNVQTTTAAHDIQRIARLSYVSFVDENNRHVCGGTLVTPTHVLTAASCVDVSIAGVESSHFSVNIGIEESAVTTAGYGAKQTKDDTELGVRILQTKLGISKIDVHEKYRTGEGYEAQYDIAFVELEEPSTLPTVPLYLTEAGDCREFDVTRLTTYSRSTENRVHLSFETPIRFPLSKIEKNAISDHEKDGDGEITSLRAFSGSDYRLADLGRGVFCTTQGPENSPVLVGLITRMTDASNRNQDSHSIDTPDLSSENSKKVEIGERLIAAQDAKEGQYPYAVSIRPYGFLHDCNGALVGPKHVLTISSCVERMIRRPYMVTSFIGDIHLEGDQRGPDAETRSASKIIPYPRSRGGPSVDLAIIILDEESEVDPVKLPSADVSYCEGESEVAVFGWGPTTYDAHYSLILQAGRVICMNQQTCANELSAKLSSTELCSFNPKAGASICNRDDGTVMVIPGEDEEDTSDDILIGIATNKNEGIDCENEPSIFLSVAHYVEWIKGVIENNGSRSREI